MRLVHTAGQLARSCHPGPTVAVSVLSALLGVAAGLQSHRIVLVTCAVLCGQLVIGWTNDLIDRERDRVAGRTDKPIAAGAVSVSTVRIASIVVGALCIALSILCGVAAAVVHLGLVVASGLAYNLWLKRSVLSIVPFLIAFGALPSVVTLSATPAYAAAPWQGTCGALLGASVHLLNVLPDLDDDRATGVRGFPHLFRPFTLRVMATAIGLVATGAGVIGSGIGGRAAIAVFLLALLMAVLALVGRGRVPFVAIIAMALLNVMMLVVGT